MVSVPASAQAATAHQHALFAPEVEAELKQADHEAWIAVTTILISIVTLGLLIGIGAVLLSF
jgi:hypothetical protein